MRLWFCLLTLGGVLGLTGCNKVEQVKRVPVTGKVTLDGRPLTTGHITFDAQNGQPPSTLDILDGRFEGRAPVGMNKVMITSIKKVSMKDKMGFDGPGYDEMVEENALPPRYNSASQITREVTEVGPNEFNFDTKSK